MRNSVEILDESSILKTRAKEITSLCRQEVRMMTEAEENEFNEIVDKLKSNKEELAELERNLNADADNHDDIINNIDKNIDSNKRTMEKRFSLVNAIRSISNNQNLDEISSAVIARGKEDMNKSGISYSGQIQLASTELRDGELVVTGSTGEHEDIIATDIYNPLLPLRAKNVLAQAGAKFLTGLVGDVQIPVMSGSSVDWSLEIGAAGKTKPGFTSKKLTPKRLTAYVDLSKQLIAQDSIDVENLVRQDIINALNNKLEATILGAGDGKNTDGDIIAPKGMFNGKTPALANDFEKIAELEANVEASNINGEMTYIINPKAKAVLRTTGKKNDVNQAIYANGEVDGTKALITTHIAENNLIYGDFSNLAIASWSGVDITVDPYTVAVNGCVRLVINAYFDAVVLRDEAFAFGKTKE